VYNVKVNNVDDLRQCIQTVWDELDQRIIDKTIKQWRTPLNPHQYTLQSLLIRTLDPSGISSFIT